MSIYVQAADSLTFCVLCRVRYPADDIAVDFGADAWGRRYGAGICAGCMVPGPNPVTEDDELVEEIRG